MFPSFTGVILAGGLNTRFSGANKALMQIGGKQILDRIYAVFSNLFEEIILVTNDPVKYIGWDLKIVTDIYPYRSSLTGIHAGLFYSTKSHSFITACDTPFLNKELVEAIICSVEPQIDIVIPQTSIGLEPLCAVYSKRCQKPIENQIEKQEFKIDKFFNKVRVKKISDKELRAKDPDLTSFFNVNSPSSLEEAKAIVQD
ncbi:MAG: molybdenum cofactor guanylyltransferase [Pseudomonadota bacterium]|nr:molybdenum cofactor guanylyltransferase [Pseudomonadota bacterium]